MEKAGSENRPERSEACRWSIDQWWSVFFDDKFKFVETSVAALLKLNGFKKDRLTWRRQRKDIIDIINFQLSQWNTKENLEFYINVAVFEPELFEQKYKYKEKNPKEWQCRHEKQRRLKHLKNTRESFTITSAT